MSYSILNSDGSTLTSLIDGSVDKSTTSLDLVGKNIANYGQYINSNFVRLLENFASDTNNSPRSPVIGQLWYDKTTGKLKVYSSNGFKSVGGAIVSSSQPNLLSSGDMWWDSKNNQLNIFNYQEAFLVGPILPKSVGAAGWTMPSGTIVDPDTSDSQQVILLENYGKPIGALSNSSFSLSQSDSNTYFDSDTTSTLVAGLTIFGDIKATGKMSNNYLSAHVDYAWLDTGSDDWRGSSTYNKQNFRISEMLTMMFPVVASTSTNEVGVPLGSEAKVLCYFANNRVYGPPYHVRRFKTVIKAPTGLSWQPYEIYSNTGTYVITGIALGAGKINIAPLVYSAFT